MNKVEKTIKQDLIELIEANDCAIHCHVEEDDPKSLEELEQSSIKELLDHVERQEARLKFLTEEETEPSELDG